MLSFTEIVWLFIAFSLVLCILWVVYADWKSTKNIRIERETKLYERARDDN